MSQKAQADFSCFEALDIRVGRILDVEDATTRKPTYRLRVDFGPDVGTRLSCGAFRNYPKEQLVGKLVIGVLNFGSKRMGTEVSEVLILGVPGKDGGTIYLTPESEVELGVAVF
jgi:tRNA-binding protein